MGHDEGHMNVLLFVMDSQVSHSAIGPFRSITEDMKLSVHPQLVRTMGHITAGQSDAGEVRQFMLPLQPLISQFGRSDGVIPAWNYLQHHTRRSVWLIDVQCVLIAGCTDEHIENVCRSRVLRALWVCGQLTCDAMQDGKMQLVAGVARLFEGAFIWLMAAGTFVTTIIPLYPRSQFCWAKLLHFWTGS